MSAPVLTITDTSDVAKGGATTDWGKVAPGASGTETEERLHNDLAAAGTDDARNIVMIAQARIQGETEWVTSGIDLLDRRGVQVQITKRNSVDVTEGWINIGTGVALPLPDLASQEYHQYKIRAVPPAGASEAVTEIKVAFAFLRYSAADNPWATDFGIHRGVGRGRTTAILSRSEPIVVSGSGASSTVELPDFTWYYEGVPVVELENDVTLSNLDGSGAALGSGESYIFLVVLDAVGVQIVKGDGSVGASYPEDAPTAPAGNRVLGHGERFADVDGLSPTYSSLDELPDYFNITTSGLVATIARSGAPAVVEGNLVDSTSSTDVALVASSTNTVQLLPDGSAAVTTDGSLAQAGALVLADIVTDGSGETGRTDRRRWLGRTELIERNWYEATSPSSPTYATRYWSNHTGRKLFIRPDRVRMMVDGIPGGAGSIVADISTAPDNGSPTTIFTSSGSDDRRPRVSSGDSSAISNGLPEQLEIGVNESVWIEITLASGASPKWITVAIEADYE